MFRRTCHALLVCTPVVLLAGCKTAQPIQRSITVTYAVPAFHFEPETRAVQKLGGITMQLAPVTYRVEERVRETKHNLRHSHARVYDPRLKRSVETGEVITNFDSIQTPYYAVEPSHVTFHVKITNQLDHVLRLAGSVVVFNVNGQVISVPQKNYSKLANAIVDWLQPTAAYVVDGRAGSRFAACFRHDRHLGRRRRGRRRRRRNSGQACPLRMGAEVRQAVGLEDRQRDHDSDAAGRPRTGRTGAATRHRPGQPAYPEPEGQAGSPAGHRRDVASGRIVEQVAWSTRPLGHDWELSVEPSGSWSSGRPSRKILTESGASNPNCTPPRRDLMTVTMTSSPIWTARLLAHREPA